MSHRKPRMKDQARALREALASKGMELGQGESLELVAKLNGFPSWNVAKQASKMPTTAAGTTVKFQLWTATHHHRHGEDLYFFTHCPSEEEVIERIEAGASSFEENEDEYIEVGGVETFDIDVPLEMAKACERSRPRALIGVYEVCMTDRFDYDTPDQVPEWAWVERMASFGHRGNGVEGGVWEFMVHVPRLVDDPSSVPLALRDDVFKAIELGAVWMLFHQG